MFVELILLLLRLGMLLWVVVVFGAVYVAVVGIVDVVSGAFQ